ncbi:uncharacterized protein [Ciconia boyciana]|uniref:uncharacterized protein n=1 Tax=Ciconia boyciana TaxID=52775 RepID=UPI003BA00CA2
MLISVCLSVRRSRLNFGQESAKDGEFQAPEVNPAISGCQGLRGERSAERSRRRAPGREARRGRGEGRSPPPAARPGPALFSSPNRSAPPAAARVPAAAGRARRRREGGRGGEAPAGHAWGDAAGARGAGRSAGRTRGGRAGAHGAGRAGRAATRVGRAGRRGTRVGPSPGTYRAVRSAAAGCRARRALCAPRPPLQGFLGRFPRLLLTSAPSQGAAHGGGPGAGPAAPGDRRCRPPRAPHLRPAARGIPGPGPPPRPAAPARPSLPAAAAAAPRCAAPGPGPAPGAVSCSRLRGPCPLHFLPAGLLVRGGRDKEEPLFPSPPPPPPRRSPGIRSWVRISAWSFPKAVPGGAQPVIWDGTYCVKESLAPGPTSTSSF